MLTHNVEKALVVSLFTFGQGILLIPLLFAISLERIQLVKLDATSSQVFVIDILLRFDDDIAQRLYSNCRKVRADPVERHARSHEHAQYEREAD